MFERTLYTEIQNGVDAIVADPTLLDFPLQQLEAAELVRAKAYWAANPPRAWHGYARDDAPFPLYAIVLGNEQERQDLLDDFAGQFDDDDDPATDPIELGERVMEVRFDVYVYAENAIACLWLYYALRDILLRAQPALRTAGLDDMHFTGAELMPLPGQMPDNMFTRVWQVSGIYELCWKRSIPGYANSVDVHHEDAQGGIVPVGV